MATGDDTLLKIKEIINEEAKKTSDITLSQTECNISAVKNEGEAKINVKKIDCFVDELVVDKQYGGDNVLRMSDPRVSWIAKNLEVSVEESSVSDSGVAVSMDSVGGSSRSTQRMDKEKRIGHRRVRDDGQITYKNILTSRIVNSIQLGIENAIAQLGEFNRDLLMQDFMTVESVPFSSSGSPDTPAHCFTRFIFKTYAPVAFGYFRDLFGIKPEDYVASFCQRPLKELTNSGNSGSIFYLTGDDRFIVKTTQSKECAFLQSLLPGYYLNLHQNPNTLLPKYFGLYCYKCDMKKIRLVAMNNILPTWIHISQTYDLKGATYKCRATKSQEQHNDRDDPPPTFKDLDFLQHHPTGIFLNNETYYNLMKTIKRDCTVLESFKIMDYSLLLGISKSEVRSSTPKEQKRRFSVSTSSTDKHNEPVVCDKETEHKDIEKNLNRFDSALLSSLNELKPHVALSRNTSQSTIPKAAEGQSFLFNSSDPFSHEGIPAFNGEGEPILIFIGIIDILQSYKFKKKMEHAFKSLIHDGDTISVHNPKYYSIRFQKFMSERVFKRLPTTKRKALKPPTITKLDSYLTSPAKETAI